ncbi:hypothetical protein E2C01_083356 [Portunus trituberculatus]|uniref:Uncharacterized protein n=1 Tax=Portunus trituberculatus TaxID=210409 RepID=A0A5B7IWZ6_PORTR|nr:hypothetical protein [Portunus trituberculatus]
MVIVSTAAILHALPHPHPRPVQPPHPLTDQRLYLITLGERTGEWGAEGTDGTDGTEGIDGDESLQEPHQPLREVRKRALLTLLAVKPRPHAHHPARQYSVLPQPEGSKRPYDTLIPIFRVSSSSSSCSSPRPPQTRPSLVSRLLELYEKFSLEGRRKGTKREREREKVK